MNTTEERIKEAFERFKPNSIERVKKLKDYAFVHYKQRDDALHAMNLMNGNLTGSLAERLSCLHSGCELDGSIIEVTLAKPVDKNQYFRFTRGVSPSTLATQLPVRSRHVVVDGLTRLFPPSSPSRPVLSVQRQDLI